MKKIMNGHYYNSASGMLTTARVIDEIANFVKEDPGSFYSLIIGSDSQARRLNGKSEISFVSAIIIYRKGKGARYFWRKEKQIKIPRLLVAVVP